MYYIGFYDVSDQEGRACFLSAKNKMDYIAWVIKHTSGSTEIISASSSSMKGTFPAHSIQVKDGISVYLPKAYHRAGHLKNILLRFRGQYDLLRWFLKHVNTNDTVIVYHSLQLIGVLKLAGLLRHFKLILEVEEIYSDVISKPNQKWREMTLFSHADGYIFPTQLLDTKINTAHKPSVIIHGTYQVEPERHCHFDDGRIHVVYAGTFDPRKGGAAAAAFAAEYLDERYHVHIIGFGSEKDKQLLLDTIAQVSVKTKCRLTYDGCLSGEEYIRFLQSCDIGLSTQNPDAAFNATSFPSKVLSYMANGLRVVSIRIESVEHSAVGDLIAYYERQTPEKIAAAIRRVDMNSPYDSRARITELSDSFKNELRTLIERIEKL